MYLFLSCSHEVEACLIESPSLIKSSIHSEPASFSAHNEATFVAKPVEYIFSDARLEQTQSAKFLPSQGPLRDTASLPNLRANFSKHVSIGNLLPVEKAALNKPSTLFESLSVNANFVRFNSPSSFIETIALALSLRLIASKESSVIPAFFKPLTK